jgi:hypothetical protein
MDATVENYNTWLSTRCCGGFDEMAWDHPPDWLYCSRRLCFRAMCNQDEPAPFLTRAAHGLRFAHALPRARRFTPLLPLQHLQYMWVLGCQCRQQQRLWLNGVL